MADMISILNAIKTSGSTEYQNRVPLATRTNIEEIANPILNYSNVQNEFLNTLINRIALTVVKNKSFKNPLSLLKKGSIPLGADIQEIFTNLASDSGYTSDGSKLLTVTKPDVKALYHRCNRKSQYPVTIYREQLRQAFTSYADLEKLMASIITALYSGDELDEFILMKNTFASAIEEGKITTVTSSVVSNEATGKAFVKSIKNCCSAMTFPSTTFNKYHEVLGDETAKPVTTWTPIENQLLIVRADVMNEIDVEVLASAFNMDKVSFMSKVLKVDSFGSASNCQAILCDEGVLEVRDNLYEMTQFYNAQGLYWNYWLNHWQTYSLSLFANCVAFMETEDTTT